jgi:hypothetical protein
MSRPFATFRSRLPALAVLALAASAGARADDSSMNPFTGDSYAYFHGSERAGADGGFAGAAAARTAQAPAAVPQAQPATPRLLLAAPRARGMVGSAFRDDTGA